MDLIAGLTGENEADFLNSLAQVIKLNPCNITVHSFANKKGAELAKAKREQQNDFTEVAFTELKQQGYFPYYMYRLSNSNGDNIGYTRDKSKVCLYNIYMMDESSTVLAAGCGGATRIIKSDGKSFKHYNFKFPYEYISRFDEIVRKLKAQMTN